MGSIPAVRTLRFFDFDVPLSLSRSQSDVAKVKQPHISSLPFSKSFARDRCLGRFTSPNYAAFSSLDLSYYGLWIHHMKSRTPQKNVCMMLRFYPTGNRTTWDR